MSKLESIKELFDLFGNESDTPDVGDLEGAPNLFNLFDNEDEPKMLSKFAPENRLLTDQPIGADLEWLELLYDMFKEARIKDLEKSMGGRGNAMRFQGLLALGFRYNVVSAEESTKR